MPKKISFTKLKIFSLLFVGVFFLASNFATAANTRTPNKDIGFTTKARTAVVIDADSGNILFEKKATQRIYPASLTKLMTLYIIFDQLQKGSISLDSLVTVSRHAFKLGNSSTGSSTMFLRPKQKVRVEDLIHGIATVSGNDASVAMAEYIAGSEEEFANYMNAYAQKLGLTGTHFVNSTGWPNVNHYSTALDIAIISRRLYTDFPQYYNFLSVKEFEYNHINQPNRNTLLFDTSLKVDGLKTGHTTQSGFSLAFSAIGGMPVHHIIGVVDGLSSSKERTIEGKRLINWVFFNLQTLVIYKKGQLIKTINVWNGTKSSLKLIADRDLVVVYNKTKSDPKNYVAKLSYPNVIIPPVHKGDCIATLKIINTLNPVSEYTYNLYATEDIGKAGAIETFLKAPYYFIKKLFM